jgi:hypothetical protein
MGQGRPDAQGFTLRNPGLERQEAEVEQAMQRLNEAPFDGEALMREYLSLIVASDQFEDNATPGFLVNPFTGEELEFDRYYPPGVAFEFQGAQHFGPTARFPDERKARNLRGRDVVKLGLCAARGIALVEVLPTDLTLKRMLAKVGSLLPLRRLDGHELLIACLEANSRTYRRNARTVPTG